MDTHRQVFGNNHATTGAFLRGAAWVNQCHTPTSVCSFVGGELHEFSPSNIGNAAADGLVSVNLHILNVKFFKGNELVFIHQLTRFLVSEVIAPIRRSFVGVTKGFNDLAARCTTFCKALFLALQSGNVGGVYLHPTLAVNLFAIAEIGKGGQAKVDTNHVVIGGQRRGRSFAREASIEVTNRVA